MCSHIRCPKDGPGFPKLRAYTHVFWARCARHAAAVPCFTAPFLVLCTWPRSVALPKLCQRLLLLDSDVFGRHLLRHSTLGAGACDRWIGYVNLAKHRLQNCTLHAKTKGHDFQTARQRSFVPPFSFGHPAISRLPQLHTNINCARLRQENHSERNTILDLPTRKIPCQEDPATTTKIILRS